MFHESIWVVYPAWYISASMLAKKLSWNTFETSNKLNKILLKWLNPNICKVGGLNPNICKVGGLNPNICKVGGLNWVKVSERD